MVSLDSLPRWALPVGIGGLVGVGVLLTRGKKSDTTSIIPVDQTTDTEDTAPSWLTAIMDTISQSNEQVASLITSTQQTEQQQQATFLTNLTSLQSSTIDNVEHLIEAQQNVNAQSDANMLALIHSFSDQIQSQIDAITQLVQHPPTSGVNTIIDSFKHLFSTAFERVTKPFGTDQPNSDITIGDLGVGAPYKQDTGFTYYDTTGHFVTGPFRQFLGNFGGAKTYGRPLSQIFRDHDGHDTQVFEHAIFKFIPGSDPTHYDIIVIPVI